MVIVQEPQQQQQQHHNYAVIVMVERDGSNGMIQQADCMMDHDKVKKKDPWKLAGTVSHCINLVLTISYALVVMHDSHVIVASSPNMMNNNNNSNSTTTILDPFWLQHGFCVSAWDKPYQTSHDWCFWQDTVAVLAMMWILGMLRKLDAKNKKRKPMLFIWPFASSSSVSLEDDPSRQEEDEDDEYFNLTDFFSLMTWSHLAHGLGHALIAFTIRAGYTDIWQHTIWDASTSPTLKWMGVMIVGIFYYLLLQVSMPHVRHGGGGVPFYLMPLLAFLATMMTLTQKLALMFSSIQVICSTSFSLDQLMGCYYGPIHPPSHPSKSLPSEDQKKKKDSGNDDQYFLYFFIVTATGIPLALISWVEATFCTAVLLDFGGHVWYDLTIPTAAVSLILVTILRQHGA